MPARTSRSCAALASGPMRVAALGRVADGDLGEPATRASRTLASFSRGTSTRRIAVHFWPVFCRMSRTTFIRKSSNVSLSGLDVGAEDGGVQRVRLDVDAHVVLQHVRVAPQLQRRARGAGEGERVLGAEVVEQVAGAAGEELEGALGEHAAVDRDLRHAPGDDAPWACRASR